MPKTILRKDKKAFVQVKKFKKRQLSSKIVNDDFGNGNTLLHVAVQWSSIGVIKLLIKSGAKINKRNDSGETPLHKAAAPGEIVNLWGDGPNKPVSHGRIEVLKILLSNSANPNISDYLCTSPFHMVLARGNIEQAKLFLQYGADLMVRDDAGWAGLHYAVRGGNVDMIRWIASCGVDLNDRICGGVTALHFASKNSNYPCVQFLLSRGVDVNIADCRGRTAFTEFMTRDTHEKDEKILRLLMDHSAEIDVHLPRSSNKKLIVRFDFEWKMILENDCVR